MKMRRTTKKKNMMKHLTLIKKKKSEIRYYCLKVLMMEDLKPVSSRIPTAARKSEINKE